MNRVILIGRLATDPEERITQNGYSSSKFRLAVDRRFARNAEGNPETDFFTVICWRQTAQFVNKYLQKGLRAAVEGSVQIREYTGDDGIRRYMTEIIADSVEALEWNREAER